MPRIGEFTETDYGYQGHIHTRDGRATVELRRIEGAQEDGPHYQAMAPNGADIGAGWDRIAEKSKERYVRVNIDDMTLPQKVQANLVREGNGNWGLMWNRDRSRENQQAQTRDMERDR